MNNHTLTLMRHAKSSWKSPGQDDHDRPLNARGNNDAPAMASRLLSRNNIPDLIICSSAQRAIETARHLIDTLGIPESKLQVERALYLSSPETMIAVVRKTPVDILHVLLVAHNPGLEDLTAALSNAAPEHLPTAAIRQFSCPAWNKLAMAHGSSENIDLVHADFPKSVSL
ncbi:MAG: histidine phosphatase family protein [Granulosicoccus sp.]